MPLQLLFDDYDPIDVPLKDSMQETWRLQFDRAIQNGNIMAVAERIARCIARALERSLDRDLQPPSENQLSYAAAIARELNVPLSGDALRYQGAMSEFLDRFAAVFKDRQLRRSPPCDAANSSDES